MSQFLVTGGAGFIGSHLCDALLARGDRVRVLDDFSTGRSENIDPRCEVVRANVADAETVRRMMRDVDGCFHLAAIASVARSNEDWVGTHRANQTGTVAVLDAARAAGGLPVVYASSAAIYGDAGDGAIGEGRTPRPSTAYGADKLGSELHARVGSVVHRLATTGFRFFNVYGPRQDPASPYSGVISIFAARLAAGQPLAIHGDGEQTRDFVYVADVVRHLLAGMATGSVGEARVFNVCTGRGTSVNVLAGTLARIIGRAADLRPGSSRAGDIRVSVGDPSAATAALGVRAETLLAAGLEETVRCLPVVRQGAA